MEYGVKLGILHTQDKLEALQAGDMSGTIIHPVLVHASHLFGCSLPHPDVIPQPIEEATHLGSVMEILSSPFPTYDAVPYIQACCLIAMHLFCGRDLCTGRDFLLKAVRMVSQANLHITLPACDMRPRDCSAPLLALDSADEERGALCQLLYIDRACGLLYQLPSLLSRQLVEEHEDLIVRIDILALSRRGG